MKSFKNGLSRTAASITLAASLCLGAGLSGAHAEGKVLAKVNGVEITTDDLKLALEDMGPSLPQQLDGKARENYLLEYLIDARLVAQKAASEKIAENPEFIKRMAYYKDKLMTEGLLTKISKTAVTEADIKKTYDEAAAKQKPETEVHARHILVASEPDAQAALKRVKGGEDFAKVAKDMSKDPGSEGGDLGWFTKERMVPEFAEAAFKMEPGQISEPVKSQFGWHIIKMEEKRQKSFPPIEQVKPQISNYLVQKAQSEMILKLREAAKVERLDAPPAEAPKADAPKGDAQKGEAPKPDAKPAPKK